MPTHLGDKFQSQDTLVEPATRYQSADDLWVITCYFNPQNYQSRAINYQTFVSSLTNSNLNFLTIECAFEGQSFLLPESKNTLHLKGKEVLWQKERLLNIALSHLPKRCTKVAWLDCDILFSNGQWARETSVLLEDCPVVQPFRRVVRLPRGQLCFTGEGETWKSFAAVYREDPSKHLRGNFKKHGHTGFAWAARRDFLEHVGLFDTCLSGSADHAIAHALCGDTNSDCIKTIFYQNEAHLSQFRQWAQKAFSYTKGDIRHIRGNILHLWHGETSQRSYVARNQELAALGFDPKNDLCLDENNLWCFPPEKTALRTWAKEYFALRKEDSENAQ